MGGGFGKVVRREVEENEVVGCELAGLAMSIIKPFHLGTGVLKVSGGCLEKGGAVVGGRLAGWVLDIRVEKLEEEGGAGGGGGGVKPRRSWKGEVLVVEVGRLLWANWAMSRREGQLCWLKLTKCRRYCSKSLLMRSVWPSV